MVEPLAVGMHAATKAQVQPGDLAVVIGAGHHGLVSAALLADAGWDVAVFDARLRPGGSVASTTIDGFIVDDVEEAVLAVEKVGELDRHLIRERALERFSPQRMADEYEVAYRQVLASRPSAR